MVQHVTPTPDQALFFSCTADIAIFGGKAGPGKSFSLINEQGRWAGTVPRFKSVIFRRTYPQITRQGGLWDESELWLPHMGGEGVKSDTRWDWRSGSTMKFSHLQHVKNLQDWQGAQLTAVGFDELPHFTESMFWYFLSRLRSTCGVKPYMRATCNPEPNSWVARLISWWIDPLTGYPIMARSGVIRWFVRNGDTMIWADQPQDLPKELNGKPTKPLSFTFIAAKDDNPHLNPEYQAMLAGLPLYDRMLLLEGNWKVRKEGGMRFKAKWFGKPATPPGPSDFVRVVRYWDRASTEPNTQNPDPDWTSGTKIGLDKWGMKWVLDRKHCRLTPFARNRFIEQVATQDILAFSETELWFEEDPGSAGISEKADLQKSFSRFAPRFTKPSGSKWVRSGPLSAACEAGNVRLAEGDWNEEYTNELEAFVDEAEIDVPAGYHDDDVDSSTGAYNRLDEAQPRTRAL